MPPELIDWSIARRVGRAVAGPGTAVSAEAAGEIGRDFAAHVRRAEDLVRDFTGLDGNAAHGEAAVLGRGAWVDANLEGIRALVKPLGERLDLSRGVTRRAAAAAIGVQVGVLLGYIAQKVLGQYDLLLASAAPGRVYFVGPNIVAAERRHGLDPGDFRLWIALHEITHRTQFTAVPWLRGHVSDLIERYLGGITLDRAGVRRLVSRLRAVIAGGPDAWRTVNLMTLFLSEEQRAVVDRMQALMTVVEGHGNFVMDRVAGKEIPTFSRMREALDARRAAAGPAERAFQRLIALDMKYQQYKAGQQFFEAVDAKAGTTGVNLVWQSPEHLPGPAELQDPDAWLERVAPSRLF